MGDPHRSGTLETKTPTPGDRTSPSSLVLETLASLKSLVKLSSTKPRTPIVTFPNKGRATRVRPGLVGEQAPLHSEWEGVSGRAPEAYEGRV